MSDAVSPLRRALGWGVHAYTALGLPIAAVITALLVEPTRTPDTYRWCFLLMVAAVIVDGTDGTLARAVRIKEAVPEFDGRRLDDLVDFLLYTCLPLLLIDRAGVLPTSDRTSKRPTGRSSASRRIGTWPLTIWLLLVVRAGLRPGCSCSSQCLPSCPVDTHIRLSPAG